MPLTTLTVGALKDVEGVTPREAERSKNMFALGLMSWLYGRPIDATIEFLETKFGAKRPEIAEANIKALQAGYAFGETTETFAVTYEVKPAKLAPGIYRNITGNQALAYGLIAASQLSGLPLFLGAYPITPASAVLEELAGYKNFGVRTFQAEDEIAAAGAAVGAAFGGALGVTTSAGPGIVLKAETIGLAIMLELPLVICDIQRAGPSTGMPTKPEQADLLMVLFGRNSESPVPVVAARSPSDCFDAAIEACADRAQVPHAGVPALRRVSRERLGAVAAAGRRLAARHLDAVRDRAERRGRVPAVPARREDARAAVGGPGHARPRAPHRRAREGGRTGNISYDPDNHELMTRLRAQKVAGIAGDIPELEVDDPDGDATRARARLGWDLRADRRRVAGACATAGGKVAHAHLTHLNPFPRNTGEVLRRYDRVLVPEMNLGQLLKLVRAEFLVDAVGYNRVRGLPLRAGEI